MVPTYEYECDQCHRTFEIRQRITAEPLTRCEACGGPLRRLLWPTPFILKGEGWYVTEYPSESRKKARDAEKSATTADTKAPASGEQPGTGEKAGTAEKSSTTPPKDPSSTSGSAAASAPTAASST
jgi:putative FmdB family regulatory protein